MKRLLPVIPLTLLVVFAISAAACSSSRAEPASSSVPDLQGAAASPTASPATPSEIDSGPTVVPVEPPSDTPGQAPGTKEQLLASDLAFPRIPGSDYYGVCGLDGDSSGCPLTERLKTRLVEAGATLCRCQNPSTTRAISAEATDFGGILYVALYEGMQSFTLTVLQEDGRLLIDDQVCMGRGPETSIHLGAEPCR